MGFLGFFLLDNDNDYRNVACITRTFFQPKFDQKWGVRVIHRTKILPHFFKLDS